MILASRREAERRGLPILGTLRGFAVKGCPPDIMGIGPAVAIPEVLKMTGKLSLDMMHHICSVVRQVFLLFQSNLKI